nr:symmetrical bis(5'-nucleosyl)-tetraphosphatase [Conchiformibius kuhniae]
MRHPDSVQTVLGNHDLHLLAIAYGAAKHKKQDTLHTVLNHPDFPKMRDWLRAQPFLLDNGTHLMVHAGLLPQWSCADARAHAAELAQALRGKAAGAFFADMYGDRPNAWHDDLRGTERLRLLCNVFTRMRVLTLNNELNFDFKANYANMPDTRRAWFDAPDRRHRDRTIVFGHWSALGLRDENGVLALDTGALWGGRLTAADLSDHRIFSVAGLPGGDWRVSTRKATH